MPEYRRLFVPGGTFFFTLVTFERRRLFAEPSNVAIFRQIVHEVRSESPFTIDAAVILPDHIHFLWTMPEGDSDFSTRIGKIKAGFTKGRGHSQPKATSTKPQRGYSDIWQPRFWEHRVRDRGDFNNHLDYIHYNPVKHGHAKCPHDWPHSSFHKWVRRSGYMESWCCCCHGEKFDPPDFSDLSARVGE
jgi:putative transposase